MIQLCRVSCCEGPRLLNCFQVVWKEYSHAREINNTKYNQTIPSVSTLKLLQGLKQMPTGCLWKLVVVRETRSPSPFAMFWSPFQVLPNMLPNRSSRALNHLDTKYWSKPKIHTYLVSKAPFKIIVEDNIYPGISSTVHAPNTSTRWDYKSSRQMSQRQLPLFAFALSTKKEKLMTLIRYFSIATQL